MTKKKKESPNRNRNIISISIVMLIIVVTYTAFTQFFAASLNQYEMTATAIEENATHSAENNGDIYAVTATRLIFQATASPGVFETEGAIRKSTQMVVETTTAEYWATQGMTATPNEIMINLTAYASLGTQTAEAKLASGCTTIDYNIRRLTVDYNYASYIVPDDLVGQYYTCPDDTEPIPEWLNYDYLLAVGVPNSVGEQVLVDMVSKAIELIKEYPLDITTTSKIIRLSINQSQHQHFLYNNVITALESGLRGQDLLDELGIVVEMP